MDLMRAAILRAPFNIVVENVEKPKAGPREILVRIKANGVCGTDTAMYSGRYKLA